jgi:hypothetical protein
MMCDIIITMKIIHIQKMCKILSFPHSLTRIVLMGPALDQKLWNFVFVINLLLTL